MKPIISKDLRYRIAKPSPYKDGRKVARVYFYDKDRSLPKSIANTKLIFSKASGAGSDRNDFESLVDARAPSCADKLIHYLSHRKEPSISMATYALLRWKKIDAVKRWAGKEPKYLEMWTQVLRPVFGDINVVDPSRSALLEAMDKITHRRRKKDPMTPQEHKYWVLLDDILSYACTDTLLNSMNEESPIADKASKAHSKLSTVAGEHLARRSAGREEAEHIFQYCSVRKDEQDVFSAIPIGLMNGMSIKELCGLNIGDYCTDKKAGVSWLQICRIYEQKGKKQPKLTTLMEDANAYRRFPCPKSLSALITAQIKRQKARNITDPDAPLFLGSSGTRMTPHQVKTAIDALMAALFHDGVHLDFRAQTHQMEEDDPSFFKGELLRATAYYFFRTRTTLSVDEIEVLMGRRPPSVYAQRYIDWNNVRVLLRQSLLLEQEWYSHIKALSPRNKQEGLHFISLSGSTQADTTLEIQAQYGIRGCIMIQKEGRA